jgi:hypothetical protein
MIAKPVIIGARIVRLFVLQNPKITVVQPLQTQKGIVRSAAKNGSVSKRAPVLDNHLFSNDRKPPVRNLQSRVKNDNGEEKNGLDEDECDTKRESPIAEEFVVYDPSLGALPLVDAEADQYRDAGDHGSQNTFIRPWPWIATETQSSQKESETGGKLSRGSQLGSLSTNG